MLKELKGEKGGLWGSDVKRERGLKVTPHPNPSPQGEGLVLERGYSLRKGASSLREAYPQGEGLVL
mgnify:CR=1 FL=1